MDRSYSQSGRRGANHQAYITATDEDTIESIKENPYFQYFLGYAEYRYEQPFTSSLFVSIRRHLGIEQLKELMDKLMAHVRKIEQNSGSGDKMDGDGPEEGSKNKGHLIGDATVAPSDIKYPTDLDLLNEVREKSEGLIDLLYVPEKGKVKSRTYRQKARTKETSEFWIEMVYLGMTITRFMRVIFWPLLKKDSIAYEKLKKGIWGWKALPHARIIKLRLLTF